MGSFLNSEDLATCRLLVHLNISVASDSSIILYQYELDSIFSQDMEYFQLSFIFVSTLIPLDSLTL